MQLAVVMIIDGDSFVGRLNGEENLYQLACVEAPELEQELGLESRARLTHWIGGRSLKIASRSSEKHLDSGFYKVVLEDSDGGDPAERLVSEGLLWSKCQKYESSLLRARAQEKGLWRLDSPLPPWVYRKRLQQSN